MDIERQQFLWPSEQPCPQAYFKIHDAMKKVDRVRFWGIVILIISAMSLFSAFMGLFMIDTKAHRIANAIFDFIAAGMMLYQGYLMYQSSEVSYKELKELTCCHAARLSHPSTLKTLKDVEERSNKLAYIILLFTIVYMVLGFIGQAMTLEYSKKDGLDEYEEEEGAPTKEELLMMMAKFGYFAIFMAALCQGACCMVCFKFTKDVTEEAELAQKHIMNINPPTVEHQRRENYGAVN